ncbi:MAG: hypothetical protein HOF53_21600 [Gammaproteobacteria bacterium]|nr:hypothetical protein [Gammaproteobacteria bacterium]MBT3867329.1 hypothetical protein [Gammaproteobacteria bacterium]MBT4378368.1 hypothetical protein [Gammaproteobacteria bacterium]MBT5789048.1 hypothetical protein [Gammaproteobacteria bacterium]MBT6667949.1 hypothetical protein [Gammaproteobacteria bacterium]
MAFILLMLVEFFVRYAPPCSPLSWAERLKRVFDIDISVCPLCGGTLRVTADVTAPDAIQTLLVHLRQRAPPDAAISLPLSNG